MMSTLFDTAFSISLSAVDSFSVELVFIGVFSFLWFLGRHAGMHLDKEKKMAKTRQISTPAIGKQRSMVNVTKPVRTTISSCTRMREPATIVPVGDVEPAQLRDPTWVVPQVTYLCRSHVQEALELYRAAIRVGLDLKQVPTLDCRQLFMGLVTSSIRVGQADEALRLMQELRQNGPGVYIDIFSSATKLCTSKQLFLECLAIYDFMVEDANFVIDDRSVWSCLLFCAIEAKSYQRCNYFFDRLKTSGTPSHKDYGNMVRFASTQNDWQVSLGIVQEMREANVEIDSVVYNTALATCVVADQVDQARKLLEDMKNVDGVADVITYNTLLKGYAKAGRMDHCFDLYEIMCSRCIKPSQVTYGILLDGCINENQVDKAAEVFNIMTREGCVMNTVLYTTLIKGFARAGQVDQAMKVYDQMRSDRNMPPDLITFSILIKANCDSSRLEVALELLNVMLELKLQPDEVIFNNLLGGCVKEANTDLAKKLYKDMGAAGIRPSNATFSILIRLYTQCKLHDEAVLMLKNEPAACGVDPEPRLYSQLAQCCLRERQGRRAIEVYKMMLERSKPTTAAHSSMLSMCVKLNMLDTAAEILSLAAANKGRVDKDDADLVLGAAIRKRKMQCAELCSTAMKQMGIATTLHVPMPVAA